jgi:dienelactone hydrolase
MASLGLFVIRIFAFLPSKPWECLADKIPRLDGEYGIALQSANLIDDSRIDPYDANNGKRKVMMSLFYPVARKECIQTCSLPYAPPLTANEFDTEVAAFGAPSDGAFEALQLEICCEPSPKAVEDATSFPLVLFSAGLLGSRLEYSLIAQRIASAGYAVATLDSMYASVIVEIPDGTSVAGLNISYWCNEHVTDVCSPTPNIPPLLETNVQDAQFVLDQLREASVVGKLMPGATTGFDTEHVAYCGHSFGGATAIRAAMKDKRIAGAVNLDGGQFGNITDIDTPVLLFGRSDPAPHNKTDDTTWQEVWNHAKGWRRQIGLENAQHRTFNDVPLIGKLAGWPVTEKLQELIGSLDGQRSFCIITAYIIAFLDMSLKEQQTLLFDGPSEAFPEVIVG